MVLPFCNSDAMALHLQEISRTVAPRAHAVLVMDQAGWHTSAKLDVPANITILTLPPRAPELNPVENVWQFMRDNWLSNRVFNSHDDIVDHCCDAWNKLVDRSPGKSCRSDTVNGRIGRDQWELGIRQSLPGNGYPAAAIRRLPLH